MPSDTPRIAELRRRLQADPHSVAFAQLAEELRRSGRADEAASVCRTGLSRHPNYVSARVTLGRALLDAGALDDAAAEFDLVLRSAPDNLAALRAMADLHERQGATGPALDFCRRARALGRFDPELEGMIARLEQQPDESPAVADGPLEETAAPPLAADDGTHDDGASAVSSFDTMLEALGTPDHTPPPMVELLLTDPERLREQMVALTPEPVGDVPDDPLDALERELRARDAADCLDAGPAVAAAADGAAGRVSVGHAPMTGLGRDEARVLQELEAWLAVLDAERASWPAG